MDANKWKAACTWKSLALRPPEKRFPEGFYDRSRPKSPFLKQVLSTIRQETPVEPGPGGICSGAFPYIDSTNSMKADRIPMTPQQWSDSMKAEMASPSIEWPSLRQRKIMRVLKALHEVRPKDYDPHIFSIGPLNRHFAFSPSSSSSSMDALSSVDRCKALCVKEYLARCPQVTNLSDFLFRQNQHPEIDYFGIPNYEKETLELLIAVDAVFILEFMRFLAAEYLNIHTEHSYIQFNQLTVGQIMRDLFIVGNQVPLSHLRTLCEHNVPEEVLLIILNYMVSQCTPFCHPRSGCMPLLQCEHLLDCLYQACVKSTNDSGNPTTFKPEPLKLDRIPQASELRKVGVKFQGVNGNTSAIRYDEKKLIVYLPKLVVFDETECMLRNLVAYELTTKEEAGEFCAYVMIMDSLIDTPDDIAVLRNADVLENHLGSDEKLLHMWNEMCINMTEPNSERLRKMSEAIRAHYKTNWRKLYVEFHQHFLSRPWYILSTLATILFLFVTALQTIYTVMSFYKP